MTDFAWTRQRARDRFWRSLWRLCFDHDGFVAWPRDHGNQVGQGPVTQATKASSGNTGYKALGQVGQRPVTQTADGSSSGTTASPKVTSTGRAEG